MYFAFPAEPSSSLSTLTSLMATTEDERKRERKVNETESKKKERKTMYD